ncbi:hypothetical protein GCM10027074_77230 [Streptomyces deserti]
MIMVSVATFDWRSIAPRAVRRMPLGEMIVMLVTVTCAVATHNLAIGVVVGCITAVVIFAKRVAHLVNVSRVVDPDGDQVVYAVTDELFLASSNDFGLPVQLQGRPGRCGHRPLRRPHLGRLLRRHPGRIPPPRPAGAETV